MRNRGSVLVMALALTILLVGLVGGFLYAAGLSILNSGWEETDAKVFWLAEAGLQKGIWNLKTPSGSGGQGESWTTAGTTENLGDGSYTMAVARWDFALAANGSSASATSSAAGTAPGDAIDGSDSTYWESDANPSAGNPQDLIITFPYALTINKVRFLAPSSSTRPRDYTWAVSSDGASYTTVVTANNNSATDVTDTFSAQSNVLYLRLRTTQDGQGNPQRVRVSTLEAIGARITSTGTITAGGTDYTRTIRQAVVADDESPQSRVAYYEPDWIEL